MRRSGNSMSYGREALRGVVLALLLVATALFIPESAEACAVCYGDGESAMTAGMNNGILVLLGVIVAVQIGFVALFLSIRQRARRVREQKDRYQLIQGGVG